jgi:hypothetical protein
MMMRSRGGGRDKSTAENGKAAAGRRCGSKSRRDWCVVEVLVYSKASVVPDSSRCARNICCGCSTPVMFSVDAALRAPHNSTPLTLAAFLYLVLTLLLSLPLLSASAVLLPGLMWRVCRCCWRGMAAPQQWQQH